MNNEKNTTDTTNEDIVVATAIARAMVKAMVDAMNMLPIQNEARVAGIAIGVLAKLSSDVIEATAQSEVDRGVDLFKARETIRVGFDSLLFEHYRMTEVLKPS